MFVHIIGGGLAGLSAAVECAQRGLKVRIYESAPRLGGRCASWFDTEFGAVIDNGTHAVVASNHHTMRYLRRIGARDRLVRSKLQMFDPNTGRMVSPFSALGLGDLTAALSLMLARSGTTAAQVLGQRPSAQAFWEPLCTAVLNTPLSEADARLLGATLRRMLFSFVPMLAATSLAETYIAPAETFIRARGGEIFLASAITSVVRLGDRITAFTSRDTTVPVTEGDRVILALPPWSPLLEETGLAPQGLIPSPIVNAHFRLPAPGAPRFIGLLGATAQWLFHRGSVATVTVSAADLLVEKTDAEIAALLWKDVAVVLGDSAMPAYLVIKERRATLRHTPVYESRRRLSPGSNAVLAGDWTHAALPCTIEAAIASGVAAANAVHAISQPADIPSSSIQK